MIKVEYKNIAFELTSSEIWVMLDTLPDSSLRFAYWCRFFTDEESEALDSKNKTEKDIDRDIKIIKKGIDRAYNAQPCYTGDLRFRK